MRGAFNLVALAFLYLDPKLLRKLSHLGAKASHAVHRSIVGVPSLGHLVHGPLVLRLNCDADDREIVVGQSRLFDCVDGGLQAGPAAVVIPIIDHKMLHYVLVMGSTIRKVPRLQLSNGLNDSIVEGGATVGTAADIDDVTTPINLVPFHGTMQIVDMLSKGAQSKEVVGSHYGPDDVLDGGQGSVQAVTVLLESHGWRYIQRDDKDQRHFEALDACSDKRTILPSCFHFDGVWLALNRRLPTAAYYYRAAAAAVGHVVGKPTLAGSKRAVR